MPEQYIIVDWANNHLHSLGKFASYEDGWDWIHSNVKEEHEGDGTYDDYSVMNEKKYKPNGPSWE